MSVADAASPSSPRGLFVVYALVVFYALCYQLQSPLEPFLVQQLVGKDKASEASLSYGRLQSLFSAIQVVSSLLFGHILDRAGVRVGFTLNFLACAASYFVLSMTSSMTMLYMSKIPGIGMAGFLCAQTAVSQLTSPGPERVRALGRLTTSYTVGGIVGPYLGGVLGAKGDYFFSAKLATLGSLVAAGVCLLLPAGPATPAAQDVKVAEPWPSRMATVLRLAGYLSGVKLITSTANSMASSAQNLVLKDQLGFQEAELGFFMSAQFAFGAFANAVLLGPVTRLMGDCSKTVVRNCVLAMAAGYALQSLVNSEDFLQLLPEGRKYIFTGIMLCLAIFQYSLSTSITAENTQRVPEDMKGSLIGMEHCIFSAARIATPAIGINVLNGYGMTGLYGACSSIFMSTFVLWNLTSDRFLPASSKKDR